jgi:hypothetical protein
MTPLTGTSFALTAFLLEMKVVSSPAPGSLVTGLVIVVFIRALFPRYLADLYPVRQSLQARQNLIRRPKESDKAGLGPFPDTRRLVPDIPGRELGRLPRLATTGILVEAAVVGIMSFA